ncbi:MAG: hypothetical protein NXH82_13390 [Rhodobacteraceae bacterium]|nr:hypothetical protein [Paracoccaceae bacterium]
MEAARLMPLLGAVLFALPLMWPRPDDPDVVAGAVATVPTSSAMAYIFGVWAVLVGAAILFGWLSRGWADTDGAG